MPWKYYLSAANLIDSENTGVYAAGGQALAGIHSSAMGAASTSDMLLVFNRPGSQADATAAAARFEAYRSLSPPRNGTAPAWPLAGSIPYDPERYKDARPR